MALVLLIDDDRELLALAKKYLQGEGYEVLTAGSTVRGIRLAQEHAVDCIVLDVMMPEPDGFEACRRIRAFTDTPILFLTGKSAERDKIAGFGLGADDYIVKPFSLPELTARIRVAVRRGQRAAPRSGPPATLVYGGLRVDLMAQKAFFREKDLRLAKREFEILRIFCEQPDTELTFEALGRALFGRYTEGDRNTVMVHVSRLRKKLAGCDAPLQYIIETVWSKGYRFTPP